MSFWVLSLAHLSMEAGVVLLAFVVQGFSGFGAGILMTPLLTIFWDLPHAVILSVGLQLISGAYLSRGAIKASNHSILRLVIIPACLASLLGVYVLTEFNLRLLLFFFGAITLLIALLMFMRPLKSYLNEARPASFPISILIGATSGLLHGLYGSGGPPMVLYLSNEIPVKGTLRATLLIYFVILNGLLFGAYLLSPALFAGKALLNFDLMRLGIVLLIPTLLGTYLGCKLQKIVSEVVFRRIIAGILMVASVSLILKGIG